MTGPQSISLSQQIEGVAEAIRKCRIAFDLEAATTRRKARTARAMEGMTAALDTLARLARARDEAKVLGVDRATYFRWWARAAVFLEKDANTDTPWPELAKEEVVVTAGEVALVAELLRALAILALRDDLDFTSFDELPRSEAEIEAASWDPRGKGKAERAYRHREDVLSRRANY